MRRVSAILLSCALLLATGCGDDAPAAAAPAASKPDGAAAKPAVASSAVNVTTPYTYNPVGKRDPFRSPGDETKRPEDIGQVCSDPLCQWDLDQLNLVAIVTGD